MQQRTTPKTIVGIVGARPNFMKIAPLWHELARHKSIRMFLVHTGQHYDKQMSASFFRDLRIPRPDIHLKVGSGSHAKQTAKIMILLEKVFGKLKPDLVLLVGDVNSTLAASVTAAKMQIPVAHVEAGLRSFDRSMPEEINRIVTDHLTSYFFTTEEEGNRNLRREGIPARQIFFVGNIMIDTLLANYQRAKQRPTLRRLKVKPRQYALLTLHRPSNVDNPAVLRDILKAVTTIQSKLHVICPIHPRTEKMLAVSGLDKTVAKLSHLTIIPPAGYLDFLNLMAHARIVLTDSGGIQEETTALRIPCLTLRNNTERPITITRGTNRLVGTNPQRILRGFRQALARPIGSGRVPRFWDGRTARRIARILEKHL